MTTPTISTRASGIYPPVRQDWLRLHDEPVVDPDLPIVDAHHHLWDREEGRYLVEDFAEDLASGHRIEATVYVECRSMYRTEGPAEFRPVGEVEFARRMAEEFDRRGCPTRVAAAVVGHTDFRLGGGVRAVLEAQMAAGGGRFRGIRQVSAWDPDEGIIQRFPQRPAGLLSSSDFRRGFSELSALGLCFEAFLFHHQIPELADLADAFPETPIMLDHVGGPLAIGPYAERRHEAFAEWRDAIRELGRRQNVFVKLSGLGMRLAGSQFHRRAVPPNSVALAEAWAPYFDICIDSFGVERCMFASNFPPDKGTCSYAVLWNAMKRIASKASQPEKDALFSGTANNFYRLQHREERT